MRTKSTGKKKINLVTLGCSKNIVDSEVIMGQLKANGKDVVHEGKGDIVVINTCGFIDNAKEESINTILEYVDLKKEGKVEKIFVTGCLSARYKPDRQLYAGYRAGRRRGGQSAAAAGRRCPVADPERRAFAASACRFARLYRYGLSYTGRAAGIC